MIPFASPLGFRQSALGAGPAIVRSSGMVNVTTNSGVIAIPGGVVPGDLLLMFMGASYQTSSIPRCDGISVRTNAAPYNGATAQRLITAADIAAGSIVVNFVGAYYGSIGYVFMVGCPNIRCVSSDWHTAGALTATVSADATAAAGDVALIFTSTLHAPTFAISGAPTLLAANVNADNKAALYSETLTSGAYSRTVTYGVNSSSFTALIVVETVSPLLDANTMFLLNWDNAAIVKEKRFGTEFTLAGNAFVDVANNELVLDGAGDWAAHLNTTPGFVATPDCTYEWWMNMAAADQGGPFSHRGAEVIAPFLPGNGNLDCYAFNGGPLFSSSAGMANAVDGLRHHWALTCENNAPFRYRLYRDGIQLATTTSGTAHFMDDFTTMYIGTDGFSPSGREVAGRIGPMRVSNVCRYPNGTAFSPPAHNAWV